VTLEQMIRQLRDRTRIFDNDARLIDELNSAFDWADQQLCLTNPNIELHFESTGTLAVTTEMLDLTSVLTGDEFYGMKTFWLQGANDTNPIPVNFMDVNDSRFIARTNMDPQVMQPHCAALVNFSQIRFAPPLPAGTFWRADWTGRMNSVSLTTNCTPGWGPLHNAILSRAESVLFRGVDDLRSGEAGADAKVLLPIAMKVMRRRQEQSKKTHKPYPPFYW